MSDIFISYSRDDQATAQRLAGALAGRGWTVWWDRNIPAGKAFDEVIREALDGARCVIVLWSARSITSDWVKDEASEGARRRVLVPCLIEDVRIPLGFGRIQTARLVGWNGDPGDSVFERLCEAVAALVAPAPVVRATEPQSPSPDAEPHREPAPSPQVVLASEQDGKPPAPFPIWRRRIPLLSGLALAVPVGLYLSLGRWEHVEVPVDAGEVSPASLPIAGSDVNRQPPESASPASSEPVPKHAPVLTKPAGGSAGSSSKSSRATHPEEQARKFSEEIAAPRSGQPPLESSPSGDQPPAGSEIPPGSTDTEPLQQQELAQDRADLGRPSDGNAIDVNPAVTLSHQEQAAPWTIGGKIEAPVRLHAPSPAYTELARRNSLEGTVEIEAIIDKDGTVSQVKVLRPLGMGLDRAATQAVLQWKFKPATLNGKPVVAIYHAAIEFSLQ